MMYILTFCLGLAVCDDPQTGYYPTETACRESMTALREDFGPITVMRECEPVEAPTANGK